MKCIETVDEVLPKALKTFAFDSPHYIHEVTCQFEWHLLKLEHITWKTCQHKSEVDVHNVTLPIDEYVRIMSILDLKYIAHEAIGGEGVAEVLASFFKTCTSPLSIVLNKVC